MSRSTKYVQNKISEVHNKHLEKLDELWDAMYEQAQGALFAVVPYEKSKEPKTAEFQFSGLEVDGHRRCEKCKQPIIKDFRNAKIWDIWKKLPDTPMLKYLNDQLMGRARQQEGQEVDPEITIIFADIDDAEVAVEKKKEEDSAARIEKLLGL